MEIDKIEICTSSQTFENGVISWRLCSKNQCAMLTGENAGQKQYCGFINIQGNQF